MDNRQFCSVCKEWLDMEIVPTGDGEDDDGVVWFRCPQCQGFLPKLKGSDPAARGGDAASPDPQADSPAEPDDLADVDLPWDSPAEMMDAGGSPAAVDEAGPAGATPSPDPTESKSRKKPGKKDRARPGLDAGEPEESEDEGDFDLDDDSEDDDQDESSRTEDAPEPVHEYAAMLAEMDGGEAETYRPWKTYEVGQCIHHVAWQDCGVVVGKESLPGGRKVIKCYFETAGVVRLIENAPR